MLIQNSDEGEKDMMVMEGIMERKPGYKGAHDYGSGAVFPGGQKRFVGFRCYFEGREES